MTESNEIKPLVVPSLAVVHALQWDGKSMCGKVGAFLWGNWENVTCSECKLEQPPQKVPGKREYVVPADVLARDAEAVVAAKQMYTFVSTVCGAWKRPDVHSYGEAKRITLDELHGQALLEDAARMPEAFLQQLSARAEKIALLAEERQMQGKISRMMDDLDYMREQSGLRARVLEEEIRQLS